MDLQRIADLKPNQTAWTRLAGLSTLLRRGALPLALLLGVVVSLIAPAVANAAEPTGGHKPGGEVNIVMPDLTGETIKARFLADSGRLLKTAYYRKFQSQLGAERPTETVIIDGLNPQQVTLVRLSDYAARNIPTTWFQRDFLPRFQGD